GRAHGIDAVVVVRQEPSNLSPLLQDATGTIEDGLLTGLARTGLVVVGAERSNANPSSIGVFKAHGISSVDSVDLTSGRVALAYALAGAQGAFGIKGTADRLLPPLNRPVRA